MNAVEIEAAISELALQPFAGAEFPFAFLAAFGNKDTAFKRLRAGNNNASDVPGGVLQRNNIHIAVCTAGAVGDTLKALRASPTTTKAKAKFILATEVLKPLFLDDLRAQLEAASDNKTKLLNLRKRMARIRVFDPACGSVNFLVIAYKQMREIEAGINRHRR